MGQRDLSRVAKMVDELCLVSLHGSNPAHGAADEIHTGSDTFVRPSMGSWSLWTGERK